MAARKRSALLLLLQHSKKFARSLRSLGVGVFYLATIPVLQLPDFNHHTHHPKKTKKHFD